MKGARRKMTSFLVPRGDALEYVTPGATFRHTRDDRMVETAEIQSVYADSSGIPHVQYDVVLEKPHWPVYRDGSRILSVRQFFHRFTDRVNG